MANEQQGVSPATAGGAPAQGPWDVGNSPATGGRNLYVRSADGDIYVGVIFEPADARRIVEAMNEMERQARYVLPDPRDAEIERLRGAVENHRRWRDAALEHGGVLVNRIAKALREDGWGESNMAHVTFVGEQLNRLIDTLEVEVSQHDQTKAERDRLRRELAQERAIYADSPDDRLYHAADNTWWRRADDGRLVEAGPPASVGAELARERAAMTRGLALLQQDFTAAVNGLLPKAEPAVKHGTHVRVFQRDGKLHGSGIVTWISKNVDPAKSEYGVQLDGYANTTVKLGEFEVVTTDG